MNLDIEKIYNDAVSYLVVTVFGGLVTWVIALKRRVNTNEKLINDNNAAHEAQIALIMQRLDSRDRQREDDSDRVEAVSQDVRELRQDVRDIKNALIGKG